MTPLPFRLGGYGTILADPPWPYQDQANRMRCGYPTMTLEDLRGLPVASIAADRALLWCWTTSSFLEATYGLVRAWGFCPAAIFPWVKRRVLDLDLRALLRALPEVARLLPRSLQGGWQLRGPVQIGGGHYVRHGAEYVLVGNRGGYVPPPEARPRGLIEAPARGLGLRHSQKPEALYEIAERAGPGPRVELFARQTRPGWVAWGNEV